MCIYSNYLWLINTMAKAGRFLQHMVLHQELAAKLCLLGCPSCAACHRLCPAGMVTLQQDKALATPVLGSLCDPHGDLPTLRCPHAAQSCVPSPLCRGTSLRLGVPGAPWLGLGWGFTGRAGPDVPHSSPQAHSAQLFIPGFIPSPFFSFFSFSFTGIKSLKIAILPKPAGSVEPSYHGCIAEQQPSRLL